MAQLSGEELERYLGNLPATRKQFDGLFDYLENKIEAQGCDHTSRFTMQYMMQKMMNFPKVSGWLSQNGGYCDCKTVEEIAGPWRVMFEKLEGENG